MNLSSPFKTGKVATRKTQGNFTRRLPEYNVTFTARTREKLEQAIERFLDAKKQELAALRKSPTVMLNGAPR